MDKGKILWKTIDIGIWIILLIMVITFRIEGYFQEKKIVVKEICYGQDATIIKQRIMRELGIDDTLITQQQEINLTTINITLT